MDAPCDLRALACGGFAGVVLLFQVPCFGRIGFAVPSDSFIILLRTTLSLNGFWNPADLNKHCSCYL